MKILIIEDDQATAGFMAKGLKESGHVTDHAADGEDGFEFARHGDYDVCVVDRMLPKLDGLTLVERLRAEGIRTPILFLSALARSTTGSRA
jgi:two-component system OmpR family response regulator